MLCRRLCFLLAAATFAVSCSSSGSTTSDSTSPTTDSVATSSTTDVPAVDGSLPAAEQVDALRRSGADDVTLNLAEFGAYFGPIPGIPTIEFDESLHPSITGPLNALLRADLPVDQRDAVDEHLDRIIDPLNYRVVDDVDDVDGPQGFRSAQLAIEEPDTPCLTDDDEVDAEAEALLNRWKDEFRAARRTMLSSYPGRLDVVVLLADDRFAPLQNSGAGTILVEELDTNVLIDKLVSCFGGHDCYIMVADTDATEGTARALAAHELFHCWHFAQLGNDYNEFKKAPAWVAEGLAGWVGETLGGGTSYGGRWWHRYFVGNPDYEPPPGGIPDIGAERGFYDLFFASYTAIGFWSHIAGATYLPDLIPTVIERARSGDSNSIYESTMRAINETARRTVAAAPTQRGELGDEWTTTGSPRTLASRATPRESISVGSGVEITTEPGEQLSTEFVFDVDPSENFVATIELQNGAIFTWQDLVTDSAGEETIGEIRCIGTCICPDGTLVPTTSPAIDAENAVVTIALSGRAFQDARVRAIVEPLEDHCDDAEPPRSRPQGSDRDPGRGGSYGHPNLVTFDGVAYVFHGAGDYALVESIDDDFDIHARFSRLNNMTGVSFNRAIAARVGNSIVSFGDDAESTAFDPIIVRVDGVEVDPARSDVDIDELATLTIVDDLIVLRWTDGTELRVGLRIGDQFDVFVPASRWGRVTGLLGDANADRVGDVATRSGDPSDPGDFDEFYAGFGASWLLTEDDSLFETPLDDVDERPIVPTAQVTLADLDPALVVESERVCLAAGVAAGFGLAQCTFDVAMTGDSRWTTGVLAMAEIVEGSVAAANVTATSVEDTVEVADFDESVMLSGTLDGRLITDLFTLGMRSGDAVTIEASSCPNDSTFEVALVSPTGRIETRSSGDDCGSLSIRRLVESGDYTIAVSDTGGFTGAYSLDVSLPGADAPDGGAVGSVVELLITDDDPSPSVSFEATAGQTLRFDRLDGINIGFTSLVLQGPDGEEVDRWPAEQDRDFRIRVDGTHTLTLDVIAGVSPGPAEIRIEELSVDRPQVISIGTEFTMEVEAPGRPALATFEATGGDVLVIASDVNDDFIEGAATFDLIGPDGAELDWWFAFRDGDVTAPSAGTYTLVFDPGTSGVTGNASVLVTSR